MATIVLTSTTNNNTTTATTTATTTHLICSPRQKRDPIDTLLSILKCIIKNSMPSVVRHSIKAKNADFKHYLAILLRFGLLVVAIVKRKCRLKNKKTDKREMQIRKRYYVTPKGQTLIRIYDSMIEQLTIF